MSDLSWLNPTPHAIAVYASQPLSPVATQHSLPSGRYSLTWAGLAPAGSHQLCLAHSLDHLVGAGGQAGRQLDAQCLRSLQVDYKLELGRLQQWQLGWFCTFENASGIITDLAIGVERINPIAHQPASRGIFAELIHRGHHMAP